MKSWTDVRVRLRMPQSLRMQLTLSYILMSMLVLGVSSFLIYYGVLTILQNRSEKTTVEWFHQADSTLQTFRNEVERISNLLLVDASVQSFLENKEDGQLQKIQLTVNILNRMQTFLGNYTYIDSIYLYTWDGKVVGTSRSSNITVFEPDEIEGLANPNEDDENNFRLTWMHASEVAFFGQMRIPLSRPLITTIRPVKSFYQKRFSGTLLINIDENVLVPLYNNDLAGTASRQFYICDRVSGNIVSSRDKSLLGQTCPYATDLDSSIPYGSEKIRDMQVIYYRMEDKGWTLIKEVPISEFISDVLLLRSRIVWIALISLVGAFLLAYLWIHKFTKPIHQFVKAMEALEKGNIGITIPNRMNNEFGTLGRGFNRMSLNILKLMEQVRISENEKRKLEIQMLQSHIHPHFLLNTLNTIKWMAMIAHADNIANTVTALSNLLRPIIRSKTMLGTLDEEFGYAKDYIKIMNSRYAEKVNVSYDCEPSLRDCRVPRLILQPVIENVLNHGAAEQLNISIEARAIDEQRFYVSIRDNGNGMPEERLHDVREAILGRDDEVESRCGIGLRNVNQRIRLHFGEAYGIRVESRPGAGTEVTLAMRQLRES